MSIWPTEPPRPGDVRVSGQEAFPGWAATALAEMLRALAADRTGPVSFALAGGSTPEPVYEALAALPDMPWDRVEIFFGDERAVPPDDPDSNYRMAREALLDRIPLPAEHAHRMRGEANSLSEAAAEYAAVLPQALDLVLLGIGTDGHTASLFPGADTLRASTPVVPALGPEPPRHRLTVSPAVLVGARRLVVLATGSRKAAPVARALTGPWDPPSCPAQLARRGSWLLDVPAAAELPRDLRGVHADPERRP